MTIGQRIALKRNELGLSQAQLGEELNVSRQSVSKWEADGAIPEIDKLITLSKRFGVTVGWLLGVEEEPVEPPHAAREPDWDAVLEHIQPPRAEAPRWMKIVMVLMALVTAASLAVSCFALYRVESSDDAARQVLQALTPSADQARLLTAYEFTCGPSSDLSGALFLFKGTPAVYSEENTAQLRILQNGEEVLTGECQWDGSTYYTMFMLPAGSDYTAEFCLTDAKAIEKTQPVPDARLSDLEQDLQWKTGSYGWRRIEYADGTLTLRDLECQASLPDAFRDLECPWGQFDLVLYVNGTEAGRIDLLNRSQYSQQVNFSGHMTDFVTQTQSFTDLQLTDGDTVRLMAEYTYIGAEETDTSKRLIRFEEVASWTFENGKLW